MTSSHSRSALLFGLLGAASLSATAGCVADATEDTSRAGAAVTDDDSTAAKKKDAGAPDAGPPPVCSDTSYPRTPTDPDNRVQIYPTTGGDSVGTILPSPTKSWKIEYQFVVPPVPCSPTWNPDSAGFYVWGDIDFDMYGSNGAYPLSTYVFNQIVPQLMLGDTLNESTTVPYQGEGIVFTGWVVEAQYFWMNDDNSYNVQAGDPVAVSPGDVATTVISYSPTTGSIVVTISTPKASSTVTLTRPFPNVSPPLFASWKDFFTQAAAKTSGVLHGDPQLNVESHYIDQTTLCQLLPWTIDSISIPGIKDVSSSFATAKIGTYSCPTALDTFTF